jgi:hypothetical protein
VWQAVALALGAEPKSLCVDWLLVDSDYDISEYEDFNHWVGIAANHVKAGTLPATRNSRDPAWSTVRLADFADWVESVSERGPGAVARLELPPLPPQFPRNPTSTMPPIQGGDGAAESSAAAGDVDPQNAELEPPTPMPAALSLSGEGATNETASVKDLLNEKLCEWIFNHDPRNGGGQPLNCSELLDNARRDPALRMLTFPDTTFRAAHQTVYKTNRRRRPAGGWPLKEPYHSRCAHNNKPEK